MQIRSIRITRDSYSASDEADAPHQQEAAILSGTTLEEVVLAAHRKSIDFLRRSESEAWVVTSKHPIAVVCAAWHKPRMLLRTVRRMEDSLIVNEQTACLHYCLIQNIDPETIYNAMDRLRYPYLRSNKPA